MPVNSLPQLLVNLEKHWPMISETAMKGNLTLLKSFLGPAFKGLILQSAKGAPHSVMQARHAVHYDWLYLRDHPAMAKLYEAAKNNQWQTTGDIDWSIQVDPLDTVRPIIPDSFCPGTALPQWHKLSSNEKAIHRQAMLSWMLSQILHGEQGALYGAAQVIQSVPWTDGKLFGATQVVDEAKHIEVFHRYLDEKLCRRYEINENLYTLTEFLMEDPRWDVKFLGMQIMIEGFGLGAFTLIRNIIDEPLLKSILGWIIADEARHVNYGVLALTRFYRNELSERERQEREDLAFEISMLMQRRFLIHEMYEEYWGNYMTRREWDKFASQTELMRMFRRSMFRLIIPNLKRLGLLSDRVRGRYADLGVLQYESAPTVYEMTTEEITAQAAPVH